jgi:hypothetical protein
MRKYLSKNKLFELFKSRLKETENEIRHQFIDVVMLFWLWSKLKDL